MRASVAALTGGVGSIIAFYLLAASREEFVLALDRVGQPLHLLTEVIEKNLLAIIAADSVTILRIGRVSCVWSHSGGRRGVTDRECVTETIYTLPVPRKG